MAEVVSECREHSDVCAALKASSQDCVLPASASSGNDRPVLSFLTSPWHLSLVVDLLKYLPIPSLGWVLSQWRSSRHALSRAVGSSKQGGGQELPTAARGVWIPVFILPVLFSGLLTPVRSCVMVSCLTGEH